MTNKTRAVFLLLILLIGSGCSFSKLSPEQKKIMGPEVSDLWGTNGELWNAMGRLPDYSFAGYRSGRKALPDVRVAVNVKNFGAVGDGKTDDTAAFESAITAVSVGAIFIPRGRYRISRPITLQKSGVVLKGEDRNETILLTGHVPGRCSGVNQGPPNCAPYSGVAMLQIVGKVQGVKLANIVANAKRGERALQVEQLSSTGSIRAGQFIRVRMTNPADNSLGCHVYADAGCLNAERKRWGRGRIVDWVAQVENVNDSRVTLVRPLRLDVRTHWSPEIWSFDSSVQEVGIENLTIQFSGEPYAGHNKEQGYYALLIRNAYNCWIRDITIVDADRGVEVTGGYNTVSGILLRTRARSPILTDDVYATGHYALSAGGSLAQDNLFVDSKLETVFVHNLSVGAFANGNVFSRITSQLPHFDHHGGAPYENLFTEITLTQSAENLFKSGGNRSDEFNGTRTTVWNLMYRGPLTTGKSEKDLPGLNLVGVDGLTWIKPKPSSPSWWVESWPGAETSPLNLYEAQLKNRR